MDQQKQIIYWTKLQDSKYWINPNINKFCYLFTSENVLQKSCQIMQVTSSQQVKKKIHPAVSLCVGSE